MHNVYIYEVDIQIHIIDTHTQMLICMHRIIHTIYT